VARRLGHMDILACKLDVALDVYSGTSSAKHAFDAGAVIHGCVITFDAATALVTIEQAKPPQPALSWLVPVHRVQWMVPKP
jgi:hypothetical protein